MKLIQGRTPQERATHLRMAEIVYGALCLLLFVCMVGGCVAPGPVRVETIAGHEVRFHPDDLAPCERGASACATFTSTAGWHIYYSSLDPAVLPHEIDHVRGLRHREWVVVAGKVCAVVTEGGETGYKKGDVLCRVDAGPPVVTTNSRIQEYVRTTQ